MFCRVWNMNKIKAFIDVSSKKVIKLIIKFVYFKKRDVKSVQVSWIIFFVFGVFYSTFIIINRSKICKNNTAVNKIKGSINNPFNKKC